MTIQIRDARLPEDADDFAQIYVASARHHVELDPERYRVPDTGVVADRYRAGTGDPRRVLIVAEVAGRVVGLATVEVLPVPGGASMIADVPTASVDVAVLPGYRDRGVGGRLMSAADERATELGARRIQLDAHSENQDAIRFYRAHGYRPMGVLLSKSLRRASTDQFQADDAGDDSRQQQDA